MYMCSCVHIYICMYACFVCRIHFVYVPVCVHLSMCANTHTHKDALSPTAILTYYRLSNSKVRLVRTDAVSLLKYRLKVTAALNFHSPIWRPDTEDYEASSVPQIAAQNSLHDTPHHSYSPQTSLSSSLSLIASNQPRRKRASLQNPCKSHSDLTNPRLTLISP